MAGDKKKQTMIIIGIIAAIMLALYFVEIPVVENRVYQIEECESGLLEVREAGSPAFEFNKLCEGGLTDEQIQGIQKGLKDIDEGRIVSHDEVRKKYGL